MAIGIGIVGAGGMASSTLIPNFQATGQANIVAVYDASPETARQVASTYQIEHVCESVEALVADPEVAAVCISSPNAAHHQASLAALAAGKHVFCEKPLARTLAEAREMATIAEQASARSGLIDAVNFSYRGYPAVRFMHDLLVAGELGEIRHLYAFYALDALVDPQTPINWRMRAASAGAGPLADIGAHLIDLTRYLAGEITSIGAQLRTFVPQRPDPAGGMASVDVDDAASLLCTLENGAMAALHVTALGGGRGNYQRIELYGSRGSVVYEIDNQESLEICFGPAGFRHHAWSTVPVPSTYTTGPTHGAVQRAFVASVLAGHRLQGGLCPSFGDGLLCQEVIDAAQTAAARRCWIDLPSRTV